MMKFTLLFISIFFTQVFASNSEGKRFEIKNSEKKKVEVKMKSEKHAYLAGGCFWGMEKYLRTLEGVIDTKVGYVGGAKETATYKQITTGTTGHAETVEVIYDANKLSYRELIKFFFRIHDPTTLNRQKNDIGTQYRSSIFTSNEDEKKQIQDIINKLDNAEYFSSKIVTKIEPFESFYLAEDYHQDYLEKNPGGYNCHLINPKPLPFD
jgi:peptide-methionine (S)-S-oxide reductase